MPPQLKCLNVRRLLRRQDVLSKAALSLSTRAFSSQTPTINFSKSVNEKLTRATGSYTRDASSPANNLLSFIEDNKQQAFRLPKATPNGSAEPPSSSGPGARRTTAHANAPGNASANERMKGLVDQVTPRAQIRASNVMQQLNDQKLASELTRQIHRRWKVGDVYAPHDLSSSEMRKWMKRGSPQSDVFDLLDLNPVEQYKNLAIMSEYVTPLGRIKSSAETGLRLVNQRRIARAIRRSIGVGLMPSVHRHPEILGKENAKYRMQIRRSNVF